MADNDPFKVTDDRPEGLRDDLVIAGQTNAVGYSAGRRVVGLVRQTNPDGAYSIYGKTLKDGITKRDWARPGHPLDHGATFYVLDFDKVKDTVKRCGMLDDRLTLDERALRGELPELRSLIFPDKGWATTVGGELRIGLGVGLTLRPTEVSFVPASEPPDGLYGTLTFVEPDLEAKGSQDQLVLGTPKQPLDSLGAEFAVASLDLRAGMFFDRLADGGWEKVSSLWLATTEGALRMDGPQPEDDADKKAARPDDFDAGTLPYTLVRETRSTDVTHAFTGLLDDARAFLLLDNSGAKTLTVTFDADGATLTLEIAAPALDIVLTHVACDAASLTAPLEPPGVRSLLDAPPLHLASQALAAQARPAWKLAWQAGAAPLRIERDEPAGRTFSARHFVPVDDWVRPAEAAVNDAVEGLSALRTLIPRSRADAALVIEAGRAGLIVAASSFTTGTDDFDAVEALRHGPLARFRVRKDDAGRPVLSSDERRPKPEPLPAQIQPTTTEPAILRPEYRMTPAVDAKGHSTRAPFRATYAFSAAGHAFDEVVARTVLTDESVWRFDSGTPGGAPGVRREATGSAGDGFGWWDSRRFYRRGLAADPRLEWLQFDKGDQWRVTPWLRLSDDSLVRMAPIGNRQDVDAPLARDLPHWDLPSSGLADQDDHGLSLLTLVETTTDKGPTFKLMLRGEPVKDAELKSPESDAIVNRLVLAGSPWQAVKRDESGADDGRTVGPVVVNTLNCFFLEFERRDAGFRVRRGMVGWSADQCFKLDADGDLQFSEFYDRKEDGTLLRTVEFNGVAKLQKSIAAVSGAPIPFTYDLKVCFWSSVLADPRAERPPGPGTEPSLRVVCVHKVQLGGTAVPPIEVVALQDARLGPDKKSLDLTADIALFAVFRENDGQNLSAPDPWEASRRDLFTVTLEDRASLDTPAAFLKLRMGTSDLAAAPKPPINPQLIRIVPSWHACETEIIPWFSADLTDRRDQTSWLTKQRLWTGTPGPAIDSYLNVTLHRIQNDLLPTSPYRACTLATAVDGADGNVIAQWVPSPLTAESAPRDLPPATTTTSKLWLFEPLPRVIAEWTAGGDDGAKARDLLAGIGWSREAVLERGRGVDPAAVTAAVVDPATTRPKWELIDSPLLNRAAAIGWLAWPFDTAAEERPGDRLPLTRQVVERPDPVRLDAAIQVLFEGDLQHGKLVLPQVVDPRPVAAPLPDAPRARSGIPRIQFQASGLRAGTTHLAVLEGPSQDIVRQPFDGPAVTCREVTKPPLALQWSALSDGSGRTRLTWDPRTVQLDDLEPAAGPLPGEGRSAVRLKLPPGPDGGGWTRVTFERMPNALTVRDATGAWPGATVGTSLTFAAGMRGLEVSLPNDTPWSEIRLVLAADAPSDVRASRSYFATEGAAVRLAGLFVAGSLRQFGPEPVWFMPGEAPATWNRTSGTTLRVADPETISIATLDMLGQTLLYR